MRKTLNSNVAVETIKALVLNTETKFEKLVEQVGALQKEDETLKGKIQEIAIEN